MKRFAALLVMLGACAKPQAPAPAPKPAPPPTGISVAHGCSDHAKVERIEGATSTCSIRGEHAFVFGVAVNLGDGTFTEIGLYGGGAVVDVPTTSGERARVKITEPLEVEGSVPFDLRHLAPMHVKGGTVHPVLRLGAETPIFGVAAAAAGGSGDQFRAYVPFGIQFAVGPIDFACRDIGLGDANEFNTANPKPDRKELQEAKAFPIHVEFGDTRPLIKATMNAKDGLSLADAFEHPKGPDLHGTATFEMLDRRDDFMKIHASTAGGSELTGWVKASDLPEAGGGRGEGISLCGCGHPSRPRDAEELAVVKGAAIHARPDGPVWAKTPATTKAFVARAAENGWRRIVMIDRLSEGGDDCSSQRLEHAWVRARDLATVPSPK